GAASVLVAPRTPGSPSSAGLAPEKWAFTPARLARMDRLCALALVACNAALIDAGVSALDGDHTRVAFGTAFGCHETNAEYERGRREGTASPRLFAYTLPSSPTGEIAIHYRLRGPALTFTSGLTSALHALQSSVRQLATGRVARVLL